jgi:hypothetical protein
VLLSPPIPATALEGRPAIAQGAGSLIVRVDGRHTARRANHFGFSERRVKPQNKKYFAFTEAEIKAY